MKLIFKNVERIDKIISIIEEALPEFNSFILQLKMNYTKEDLDTFKDNRSFWIRIRCDYDESYPSLLKLANILLTIPLSSVDCERGFSRLNLIKTKNRDLGFTMLNNLMFVGLNIDLLDETETIK